MNIVCLDLEGVLVPEIWIAFAEASGIPELKRTTRDEPNYDKLMAYRMAILKEHGLGLKEIQETIAKIDPMPGAKEFLDKLRAKTQVIIISDTFTQFAKPLMQKLGWPTIFCNTLEVNENGEIVGFLGPNGAGKSSLMKIMTGYLYPDSGRVWIDDVCVQQKRLEAQKLIGYLPEHNPLYLDLYVKEYLNFTAKIYDLGAERADRVEEMIENEVIENEITEESVNDLLYKIIDIITVHQEK